MYNKWGGPVVQVDGTVSDDDGRSNADIDRASVKSLEETQQSWLLGAAEPKKKKGVDLGCMILSRRACCVIVCLFVFFGFVAGLTVLLVKTLPKHEKSGPFVDNYTQALHLALRFFDVQKSGKLPRSNNISWRADAGLKDGLSDLSFKRNLVGGFHDAGDNIKFTFPTAFSLTLLSWSVIEYKAKYVATKEYDHVRANIKWGTDYLFKTFKYDVNSTNINEIVVQVGTGGLNNTSVKPNDHYCWERPEKMDYERPVYVLQTAPDVAGEMAAAMAAASIVFKEDSAYSNKLVTAAKSLLKFAEKQDRRVYSSRGLLGAKTDIMYNSSGFWDEYLWGGAWLYFATGNKTYLERITNPEFVGHTKAEGGGDYYGVFSWDNKVVGSQLILTRLRIMQDQPYPYEGQLKKFNNQTDTVMCSYLPVYKKFKRTKGGLTLFNKGKPAPLQYVANAAFLSALYADYMDTASIPGWICPDGKFYWAETLRNFSRSQIDYILGKNPNSMSYVVGFSKRYPIHVHHRAASIPLNKNNYGCKGGFKFRDSPSPNKYVAVGAMVGGPDKNDKFVDKRANYTFTEPTIAGNAGLVGALIALSEASDFGVDRNTLFSAIPPAYIPPPPPPPPWGP